MRIRVKGYFHFKVIQGPNTECTLDLDAPTLRNLLDILCKKHGRPFRDQLMDLETGRLQPLVQLLINGRHIRHLPQGLDTNLEEGDIVSVFPIVAGG